MGTRVITCGAGLCCGLSLATQIFAYMMRLDPALGLPWWRHHFLAFYAPWGIIPWAWQWAPLAPRAFLLPTMAGLMCVVMTIVKAWPPPRTETPKPQARWATRRTLQANDIATRPGAGPVLGQLGRHVLRACGGQHLLIVAGTGTGKTVAIVRPTLLEYQRSMIIHDPKGGLYEWLLPDRRTMANTAGYRARLGKVVLLAPLQDDTDGLNLWDMVRVGTDEEYRDVQMISHYLANPEGKVSQDETSQHFRDLVNLFMPGVFLYGLHTGLATTGAAFNELVNGADWQDLLTVMQVSAHPIVRQAGILAGRPGDNERGSLQTSLARCLSLFNDPRIARMTNHSTFCLADLREQDRPCTVYLSVPFPEQERLRMLVVLFLRLMLDHCVSRLTGWRHDLLFVGEEFPSLGRCDFISHGLNHAREFGVSYCLITPSMEELIKVYGPHHNFLDGCRVQVSFGLTDPRVAETFSKSLGTRETHHHRVTTQRGGRRSMSEDVREEPLLNVTGLLDLEERAVLVKAGRHKRILQQARYYEHRVWRQRSQLPLPARQGVDHV